MKREVVSKIFFSKFDEFDGIALLSFLEFFGNFSEKIIEKILDQKILYVIA